MESVFNQRLSYISQNDKNAIQKIVSCFVDALHPLSVYLFGSFAENRVTDQSDYDFYIVIDDNTKERLFTLCYKAQKSIGNNRYRPCDIIVDKQSFFNDLKNNNKSLEYDVYHKGVKLYEQ